MQKIRYVLVGLGNLGRRFCEVIVEKAPLLREQYDLELVLVGASDSRGAAYDANGLDPARVARIKQDGGSVGAYPGVGRAGWDALSLVRAAEADVLLEASPVNLVQGAEPGQLERVGGGAMNPAIADFLLQQRQPVAPRPHFGAESVERRCGYVRVGMGMTQVPQRLDGLADDDRPGRQEPIEQQSVEVYVDGVEFFSREASARRIEQGLLFVRFDDNQTVSRLQARLEAFIADLHGRRGLLVFSDAAKFSRGVVGAA